MLYTHTHAHTCTHTHMHTHTHTHTCTCTHTHTYTHKQFYMFYKSSLHGKEKFSRRVFFSKKLKYMTGFQKCKIELFNSFFRTRFYGITPRETFMANMLCKAMTKLRQFCERIVVLL